MSEISKFGPEAYLAALYPDGPPAPLRIIRSARGDVLGDLGQAWRDGVCIHFVFESGSGAKEHLVRFFKLAWLRWRFLINNFDCQLVGVFGSVERPAVVLALRRNILRYAHNVTFRCGDLPFRAFIKRIAGHIFGSIHWNGPVILICTPKP